MNPIAITTWVLGAVLCALGAYFSIVPLCVAGGVLAAIGLGWVVCELVRGRWAALKHSGASENQKKKVRFAVPEVVEPFEQEDERPLEGPQPVPGPRQTSGFVTTKPFRPYRIQTGPATGAG